MEHRLADWSHFPVGNLLMFAQIFLKDLLNYGSQGSTDNWRNDFSLGILLFGFLCFEGLDLGTEISSVAVIGHTFRELQMRQVLPQ
jgi:hypothetical protein